ncbi:hypothetical protein HNP33_001575 [Comamonas odontotermitis]|uniref:Peptidase C58 YopT-type domain-containing protein n=1 Tax=Comamonas odontotermitis TaxID=379895 RepID=A0ABR6RED4_9BURK|nr:hypothetical protein [Comamonas odontotermitis]
MKISPNRSNAIASTSSENRLDASTQRSNCTPPRSSGPLAGLSTIARNRPTKPTNARMGMDPYHYGTQNDCGLHTLAAKAGCSKEEVCERLGLSRQEANYINENGMSREDFANAFQKLTGRNTNYRSSGSTDELIETVSGFREGKRFAIGIERESGIGHLVAATRGSNSLEFDDRQINSRYSASSREEVNAYLSQQGGANYHVFYSRSPTGSESPRRGGEYSRRGSESSRRGSESSSDDHMDYSSGRYY